MFLLFTAAVAAESVNLSVISGTPQNGTYIFSCVPDFTTSTFDWDFGDTVIVPGITGLVQHTYVTSGNYTVSCTGIGESTNASAALAVGVDIGGMNTTQESNVTNETNQTNITNTTNSSINTSGNETTNETNVTIPLNETNTSVNQTNTTENETNETHNETIGEASITIKAHYPQSGAYIFECNTPNMTPTRYSWYYGDGQKSLNITNQNVFHTYLENGNYEVMCSATDGSTTAQANRSITIGDIPQVNSCSAMQDLAATCEGGTITQQDFGKGCRTIICSGNGGQMEVLACDKPSADNPLYFDLYKKSSSADLTICLGGTCIHTNGFARSPLQACFSNSTGNGNNTTNTTNVTENTTNNGSNQTKSTTAVNKTASLVAASEVPPNNSTATGSAMAMLNGSMLSVSGVFSGLVANVTDAHVHIAPVGIAGSVVLPLDIAAGPDNMSGNISGSAEVNSTIMDAFANGTLYVNVHSETYPDGEIRGQLT
jgi:hypothetical protein